METKRSPGAVRFILVLFLVFILPIFYQASPAFSATQNRITSISPSCANPGNQVTITGFGFGALNIRVTVGGISAQVTQATGNRATFIVPLSAPRGPTVVVMWHRNGSQEGNIPFQVGCTHTNRPPIAHAGLDQDVTVGDLVTLDARNSSDPDGDLITYLWAIVNAPAGSSASLMNHSSVMPTFIPEMPGEYRISLVVNDGKVNSLADEVVVIASTPNVPPTAHAGPDQSVVTGNTVYLDGTGSFDPDGDPLIYHWEILSRPAQSTAVLDNPSSPTPSFIADKEGQFVVALTVNDGQIDSLPDDIVAISAIPNALPVAFAGNDQVVSRNTIIQLDGTGSADPNNDPLTYTWSIVSKPLGSSSSFNNPNSSTPTILADKEGELVFRLVVNDGKIDSAPDTVVVIVVNDPPVANAGPDHKTTVGTLVTLNGSGSSDPNGDPLSYQWTLISAPSGATAILINPTSVHPSIMPDKGGIYTIQLVVNDGQVDSSVDTATVIATIPMVVVPDVVGVTQGTAESTITSANLTVGIIVQAHSPIVPAGNVISQNPLGGSSVLQGTAVDLVVSLGQGMVSVPDVVGMAEADVGAAIIASNLTVGTITAANSATMSVGLVVSQNPIAGVSVPQGTALNLDVSIGPVMVRVPNIVGSSQAAATSAITGANLIVGTITTANSTTMPAGLIISQNPAAGVSVPQGTAISFVLSLGPPEPQMVTVPNVVNLPQSVAQSAIIGAGFTVGAITTANSDMIPTGIVNSQTPLAGTLVAQGSSVDLVISLGANRAPLALDDAYEVRVNDTLTINPPGVLGNDNDPDGNPLTALLVTNPTNGLLQFNPDGSFTYRPYALQGGQTVYVENVNLPQAVPGVTYNASSVNGEVSTYNSSYSAASAFDGSLGTSWLSTYISLQYAFIETVFPQDVTVSKLQVYGHRNTLSTNPLRFIRVGVFQLFDGAGVELFNSGSVTLSDPEGDGEVIVPDLSGVRRARFTDTERTIRRGVSEFKVIGSATVILPFPPLETNLAQLLPTRVRAEYNPLNPPEKAIDAAWNTNWYVGTAGAGNPTFELIFPIDVTVSELQIDTPTRTPGDSATSSLPISCFGNFELRDAGDIVLFDSGPVNQPKAPGIGSGSPTFSLSVPNITGVRAVRYNLSSCSAGTAGFSEARVYGSAPVSTPAFDMSRKFQALLGREIHSTPLVVNLTDDNGDGQIDLRDVPDIVAVMESTASQLTGEIKVSSGDDGRELLTIGGPNLVSPWSEPAVGDIDGDGLPEIVAVHSDGNHLIAFEHTGEIKWVSDANPMPRFNLSGSLLIGGAVSIANLDGAGRPEIIVGASVFDADGRLLGDGRTLGGTTGGTGLRSAISAIADLDLDGLPEIIAGPTAYRLTNGRLTKVWQRTDRPDGFVGIGNFDDDPFPEIVVVANGQIYLLNHDGTDAEVWNPPTHAPVPIPGGGAGGAPTVADLDGDGLPEIGLAGAGNYVVFNRDGSVRWSSAIKDRSSHSTGSTVFDFDGDGSVEILYRDENYLRVYRGSDGVLLARVPVGSSTWAELPVVADVDNDGHAEIIVSSNGGSSILNTGIHVFQDPLGKWARTRRIWNQHSYHITNVNEDGTIPLTETPNWLVPGLNNFRLNAFIPGETQDQTDSFTYRVSDGSLDSNAATVRITLRAINSPPRITSTPIINAATGAAYLYGVSAIDPDIGDTLTFSLPTAPAGMSINPITGLIQWTPGANQLGSHNVVVKVQDAKGLFALQSYTVQVATPVTVPNVVGQTQAGAGGNIASAGLVLGTISNQNHPVVPLGSVISQSPVGGTLAVPGSAVNIVVSLGPAPGDTDNDGDGFTPNQGDCDDTNPNIHPNAIDIPGNGIDEDCNGFDAVDPRNLDNDGDGFTPNQGDCDDTNPNIHPGALDIPGNGIDENCNGADSIPDDTTPPTVLINTPAEDATVTFLTDIIGTADDANFLRYVLQIAPVDSPQFVTFASGTVPVIGGVLGQFDPTLLENGIYRIRLVAEDVNGQISVDERVYRVAGEAKPGVFALSFIDLQIPVSGIPITVIRSYDSRIKEKRDFGIGWDLQIKTGSYKHNRTPGLGWIINDKPFLGNFLPCIGGTSETRSHFTEVRLSDREVYSFALGITNGNLGITGACEGEASFRFIDGPTPGAKLDILDGTSVIYLRGGSDQVLDMNAFLDGTEVVYNPKKVRLRTIDGRKIDFDRTAGITRIEDNNGNQLSITPGGITHSSGKSIAFQRDLQGRITRITDPIGNMLNYSYDGNGDLVEFFDQLNNRTTFTYDTKHNLIEITDPLGNRAVRSEYDADGRLIAVIDALGRRTAFTHNLSGREEVVTDAQGHATRLVYDDQGNILSHEKSVTIDGTTVLARSQYAYDSKGNQTLIVSPDNLRWENTYDAFGNPLTMTLNPGGLNIVRKSTFTAKGEILTETDPNGGTAQFAYDAVGNPDQWTDIDGRLSLLTYNSAGQVTHFRDSGGRMTRVAYDASGNVQSRTDSLGNVTTYNHDGNGNKLTQTATRAIQGVQKQVTTRFEYNAMNQLTKVIDPLGQEIQFAYNVLGKKASETDKLGRVSTFEYDEVGSLIRTNYPDGTAEMKSYDAVGNLVEIVDREGLRTQFQYDELRRRIETALPNGGTFRTLHSPGGQTIAQIAPDGSRTDYEYDTAGRMILTRQPAVTDAISGTQMQPEWRFEYDAGGRRTAVVDPKGNRTQFTYNSASGTVTVRMPDGSEVVETKDQWGRILQRTDQEGNQTTFEYLADTSRLVSVTLPAPAAGQASPVWRFAYDEVGNRITEIDPLDRITRFEYDEINRLTRVVLPGGQTRSFIYDAVNKVTGMTDFDGSSSSFEFDVADRLVKRILADGSITTFTYTPGGRRASVLDQRGLTSYGYDAAGRLISVSQPGAGDIQYAYDHLNRVTRITTPGGSTVYTHDPLGRLSAVIESGGSTGYAYDLAGNLARLNMANGVAGTFAHDQNNRMTSLIYQKDSQTIGSFGYLYMPSGRRMTITETGATTSFNYDRVGRLVQEIRTGANPFTRQYEYDAAGNRTRLFTDGTETLYSYDVNDRLLTAGVTTFTYDDKGNLTQRNDSGLVTTYAWTPDNRLATLTTNAGVVRYEYDADGMRVGNQSSQGSVRYLVDGLNPSKLRQVLEERDGFGGLLKKYTYGAGLISVTQTGTELFYLPDGQGHIRMLTDTSGQVAAAYAYDSYGRTVAESGATGNDYLYTGQKFDSDANLYYLRARYYDPGTGRFLGPDPVNGNPLNPVSLHRYIYAANDPVNYADPSGEIFTLAGFSFAQVISGGLRGLDYGTKFKKLCDVKGLAKIIPLAIGLRGWIAGRSQFVNQVIDVITPSIGFAGANNSLVSVGRGLAKGSLAPLLPGVGLSIDGEIFKHPLADLVPPPQRLIGDPKKLEIEVGLTSLTEIELKLTGTLFPSTQGIVGPIKVQHSPSWALKSVSGGIGIEHPICDIRVCGVISVGTVSAVVTGSVNASGFSSSAVSGSFEIGLKVEVPFLPEGNFTIIKIPDDFK